MAQAVQKNRPDIGWQALDHVYYEKSSEWYWWVGVVGGTLGLLALIFDNWVLCLLIVIATLTTMLHGAKVPDVVDVSLTPKGVRVGKHIFLYSSLYAFSLDEESDPAVLVLDSKAFLVPDIHIYVEGVSTEDVRDYLLDHLDEKYHEPTIVEGLIHYLGF